MFEFTICGENLFVRCVKRTFISDQVALSLFDVVFPLDTHPLLVHGIICRPYIRVNGASYA